MSNIILFPFAMVVAIYIVIAFTVPTFKENSTLKEEIAKQEASKEKLEEDYKLVQNFKRDIESHKEESEFLSKYIPADASEQDLLNTLSRYASESNVSMDSLLFTKKEFGNNNRISTRVNNKSETDSNLEVVSAEILFTGSYDNMRKFVDFVFSINRLFNFELASIDVLSSEDGASKDFLSVAMTFDYFSTKGGVLEDVSKLKNIDYAGVIDIKNSIKNVQGIEANIESRNNPFMP